MTIRSFGMLLISTMFILLTVSCGGDSQPPVTTEDVSGSVGQTAADAPANTPTPLPEPKSDPVTSSPTIPTPTPTSTPTSIPTPTSEPSSVVAQKTTGEKQTETAAPDGKSANADTRPGLNQEKCQNATGAIALQCMDDARKMIEQNPALCDTATGMMAYMCNAPTQSSQGMPAPAIGHQNPCASLTGIGKEMCEESFKNNPYARPTPDPNNTGRADPDARLATDEVNYSNIYLQNYDPDNLPKVAKANFTELDKFSRMSKIRSGVGHDFSYNTPEYDSTHSNCKSMKHYFIPAGAPRENAAYAHTPHAFEWMSIKFFSPVDGRIVGVSYFENEYGTEAQFTIASTEYPGYYFMFFHLALDPDLKEGSVVQAGQQIATLGDEDAWGEIAVSAKIGPDDHRLLSFLQVATDEVFQEYVTRGVVVSSDVIVTKEQRDANPLACDDSEAGWFFGSTKSGVEDIAFSTWVFESADNWFFFDE